MNLIKWLYNESKGKYICQSDFVYYSKRYDEKIMVEKGFKSDGATYAIDIKSNSWGLHDKIKKTKVFLSGAKCGNWKASVVLFDVLVGENRFIRAIPWFMVTLIYGYYRRLTK